MPMPIAPSHWSFWQSPGWGSGRTVVVGSGVILQTLETQRFVMQGPFPAVGQSTSPRHSTQVPVASQKDVPLQVLCVVTGGFDGVPFVHRFWWQVLGSDGRSLSSFVGVMLPAPSQTFFWQSPA